ncbi:uncharacterized protein LOC110677004 [Aedes aegypti]|uniref:Uncharacterized protein n=1 Tax=Aedes aegypti TaxID=7159 RepID=A0A6I8TZH2_AEDAE|nr:uncharacterized protein LOC110677004 [Aedes aegypti]
MQFNTNADNFPPSSLFSRFILFLSCRGCCPFRLRIEGKFFRLRSTNYRRFIVPVPLSPFSPRLLPSNRCIHSGSALSDQLRPTNYRSRFCCRSGRFVFSLGWFRPVGVPVPTSPTTTERR